MKNSIYYIYVITCLLGAFICSCDKEDYEKTFLVNNDSTEVVDSFKGLLSFPSIKWGEKQNSVKQLHDSSYEIIESTDSYLSYYKGKSKEVVVSYQFDSDSLFASSLIVTKNVMTDSVVRKLLSGYEIIESKDKYDVYTDSLMTTMLIYYETETERAFSWIAMEIYVLNEDDYYKGIINGHEYVDLGLSVKWATCNLGTSKPENNGSYFQWGENKASYSYWWADYEFWNDTNGDGYWLSNELVNIGKNIENTKYDAAKYNWGEPWRMPTRNEMQELIDNCSVETYTENGKEGYKLVGPNGQSIFLRNSGYMWQNNDYEGKYCMYWTGTRGSYTSEAWCGRFVITKKGKNNSSVTSETRGYALPIRPVCK